METSGLFRKAHGVLKQLVEFSAATFLTAQVLAVIVFPLIETGLWQVKDIPGYALMIVYFVHVIVGGYAIIGLYKLREFIRLAGLDTLEQEILEKAKNLLAEQDKTAHLSSQIDTLITRSEVVKEALCVLRTILRERTDQPIGKNGVARLIAPLVQKRREALGFDSGEMYNFVMYLNDKKAQLLKLYFRECDNRIKRQDRSWRHGVGHVGAAFARRKTIVGNISDELPVYGDYECPTDKDYYASHVATPIFCPEIDPAEAIGVFAVTSSRNGHLNRDHALVTEIFSIILSVYFSTCSPRDEEEPSL